MIDQGTVLRRKNRRTVKDERRPGKQAKVSPITKRMIKQRMYQEASSSVHRVYRGRYFAIGAGFSCIFCSPNGARVVFVMPRAPIWFHAGQEKSKPDNQPNFPVFR